MNEVFAGIDVGSTTTKVVLLSDDVLLAQAIAPTGANCRNTARELYERALSEGTREESEVAFVVSTGYGRRLVDFRTEIVSEITANAVGACFLGRGAGQVRTIIDVGGQDSKAISLDEGGRVANFAMNDKCAAGTGRFLEVMSRTLEMDLDGFARAALEAAEPIRISSLCTVFAESEVIGLLSEGKAVPDIVAGVHESIAARVGALVRRVTLKPPVFFDGGGARNPALRKALEKDLGVELIVPDDPQMVTATGAALIARDRHLSS